jgi:hypothetical protein
VLVDVAVVAVALEVAEFVVAAVGDALAVVDVGSRRSTFDAAVAVAVEDSQSKLAPGASAAAWLAGALAAAVRWAAPLVGGDEFGATGLAADLERRGHAVAPLVMSR